MKDDRKYMKTYGNVSKREHMKTYGRMMENI